nr:2922_t:CDS:2 [Entrophospora candida]
MATYKCTTCETYKRSKYEAGCYGSCGKRDCRDCCETCGNHTLVSVEVSTIGNQLEHRNTQGYYGEAKVITYNKGGSITIQTAYSELIDEKKVREMGEEEKKDYHDYTRDQLIAEINRLKSENEQLRNNQNLTSSEKESRLQKNRQKLEELKLYYNTGSQSGLQSNNNRFSADLLTAMAHIVEGQRKLADRLTAIEGELKLIRIEIKELVEKKK